MKTITVKEMMVPLLEYATVSENANLNEAVIALQKAQEVYKTTSEKHRAILVYDAYNKIVGKLSQLDILKALEPKYKDIESTESSSRFSGFSLKFLHEMVDHYKLWDRSLNDICRKANELKVKDFMYKPTEGEYVTEDTSLELAVHQLVIGGHQSLLVKKNKEIVGILKLADVFKRITDIIQQCPA
ncbi:CBS domain-containing protein [Candidatus Magnetomoraceae bacterium gMMP-13]